MSIEKGNFVKINYTGQIKETGDVFDTTSEEIANEVGLTLQNKNFGPIPIIVGGGHLLQGLDESIIGMEKGDKKTIELAPADAFGERDPKKIQLFPMKEFKKQGIRPEPGMTLSLEGQNVKIQSVSGGRVRVDMNHELAGKTLIYDIEVYDIIEDEKEQIKSLIELHYPAQNLDIDRTVIENVDGIIKIELDEIAKFDQKPYTEITFARFRIAKDIWDNIENVEKVEFVDSFIKRDEEDIPDDEEDISEEE